MDPFIGQLMCVGFNFAPPGWAVCDGSLLSISQNSALFSLLGTTYGGNGTQNFALPDLRGRAAVGIGTGPGLPNVAIGQVFGSATTTIQTSNLPAHAHGTPALTVGGAACVNGPATSNNPNGTYPAIVSATSADNGGIEVTTTPLAYAAAPSNATMAGGGTIPAGSTLPTGSNIPIDNQPPSLGLNWIIATQGIYPSRQ